MILPLQLRQSTTTDTPPAAWFLAGHSAKHWLEELARCGLAGVETRLFVVPRSLSDRLPAGLLVVPGEDRAPTHPPAGLACQRLAGRLYVPSDAVLQPPITDAELRDLCPLPVVFLHPALGLSGFEEESALRVWDLIEMPDECAGSWNFARAGASPLPSLVAVALAEPPTHEDLFGDASQQIASEPAKDLPPAPGEPEDKPLANSRRLLKRLFLQGVAGAMRQFPRTASHRTWVNDVEDWARRGLRGASEQLERLRHKELHRLLNLFENDPERALRHAIPMNHFASRGQAPPGARLGPRSLDFDPNRLGGGPADYWHAPPDLREMLYRRYREMADREMQLGRYRRAAYIFGELLGDLPSAANALRQGGLFREAALIYDEHLQDPLAAARCLAEGGLLHEAIERYVKLGRWLDVADLQERLGNSLAAIAAIRRVVNERLAQNDFIGAAQLVDERLHLPDEAVELLLKAWPSSHQAIASIGELFKLLARLVRHDTALERIARFRREEIPTAAPLPLLSALAGPALNYPDELVRHRASDLSRVIVARMLGREGVPVDAASALLEHVVRLAPEDRLLARDANRHLAARRSAEIRIRRVTPTPTAGGLPVVLRRFELPRQIQWLQLRQEWHWFYALGVTPKRLTLLRGIWEGELQSLSWDCPGTAVKDGFIFEPTSEEGAAVALARPGGPPLAQKRFPAADAFFNKECVAGTPGWLPNTGFPFAIGEDLVWSTHVAAGRAILSCLTKRGQLQRTTDVTEELLNGAQRTEATHVCLSRLATGAAIALGNRIVVTRGDGGLSHLEIPGQVVRMFTTLPHTRQGIALMLEYGAALHWIGTGEFIELERDLPSPLGAFVPGGPLVLISHQQAVLLDVDARGVHAVTRMKLEGQRPIAVSGTSNPGEFAVLGAGGEMTIYRMPR